MRTDCLLWIPFVWGSMTIAHAATPPVAVAQVAPTWEDTLKKPAQNWFHLDPIDDKTRGVSSNKAYRELLKGKKSQTVVVAVIDSGVDIEHEDLKSVIWTNTKEVAGNGKDDDGNGYVDDIHGWNFIGGTNGENVNHDSYELTRQYVKYSKQFDGKTEADIAPDQKAAFAEYQSLKKKFEDKVAEISQQYSGFKGFFENFKWANRLMQAYLNVETVTLEDIEQVESSDERIKGAANLLGYALQNGLDEAYLADAMTYFEDQLQYGYNTEFDPRSIVGDNYDNPADRFYGNNDVTGPDAEHGTHVAGIIAAARGNGLGMDGIADNVQIMSIRAVPNGDERDKDVANAIRYAVDNGAKIINMSFGKSYSPNKALVDEAVKYAESKGVLLVHAAGNDSKNLDTETNFPNRLLSDGKTQVKNWLEIGASSWGDADNFVGDFSNFGKKTVDLFSPGVDIYSTIPGGTYKNNNGTSMAAPVAAGVAAVLMSYYPELSALQVKDILMKSALKDYQNFKIAKPGGAGEEGELEMIKFGELSISGGLVNAYEAVKMAESMKLKSKKR